MGDFSDALFQSTFTDGPAASQPYTPLAPPKDKILGPIGDFFSWISGAPMHYKERKDEAQLSADLGPSAEGNDDFASNPLAAIRRIAQHKPELALELLQKNQELQTKQTAAEAMAQYRQAQQEARDNAIGLKAKGSVGALLSTIKNMDPSRAAQTYARLLPGIRMAQQKYGMDDLLLPDTYDPDVIAAYSQYGGTPNSAETEDWHDIRGPQLQQGADAATARAGASVTSAGAAVENAATRRMDVTDNMRHRGVTEKQGAMRIRKQKDNGPSEIRYGPDGTAYVKGPDGRPQVYHGK